MLTFDQALQTVRTRLEASRSDPDIETLPLDQVRGRILAEPVRADRDYPPFDRAIRDGYAVLSSDLVRVPVTLECVGEARAGAPFTGSLAGRTGSCVSIMTGAPVPQGADAVAMVEHTSSDGHRVEFHRSVNGLENVVRQGSEAPADAIVLPRGRRLGSGEIGLLAAVGKSRVAVFRPPHVAILPTGDEVVPVDRTPQWFEIRNSNAWSLAAQVAAAGGVPRLVGIAADDAGPLRTMIENGLKSDLLLLSGGISVGKYDLVKQVLSELGAEFFFHGVAIRPGKPLAFGGLGGKFFFGLPGNPVSTFVTFELFARPAIQVLSGAEFEAPLFLYARLAKPFRQRTGLTAFLPARVEAGDSGPVVEPVGWQGSGDLVGVAAANCFLVVRPDQTDLAAGDRVDVLPKPL